MKLANMLVLCIPILMLANLADLGSCVSVDTQQYLNTLADMKAGNYSSKGKTTVDQPWVYTSQGSEFEERLKQLHNSRVAVPDKPKLVAPKMPVMKADDPGMTWLEIVGLVCLVAGSALFVIFAAACWIKTCGARTAL